MRLLFLFLSIFFSGIATAFGQTYEQKACREAMSDFNAYLESRSVDAGEFAKRVSHLLELQTMPPGDHVINEFETTKDTLTQLLTTAGFFPDDHLDVEKLHRFITAHYTLSSNEADSLSTLYKLSEYIADHIYQADLIRSLSPGILVQVLQTVIGPAELENDFFRTCYVVLLMGYIRQWDQFRTQRNAPQGE